jgi:hypothetical protein
VIRCLIAAALVPVVIAGPAVAFVVGLTWLGADWVNAGGAGIPVLLIGFATDGFGQMDRLGRWVRN